ncbi:ABC transporter permease subunit [Nonomuraea angiospora]|uniref:ABC transporter permease subunit n=1 Tax=Nonomuraea angiospora TaxID=46172 RepID=UPI0029B16306|nr:ABC transporter permease subunit [Nonomuraea angiospora]MDX3110667.1 ABC transporter permease subunit [Nonomuraea angiospora]
MSAATSGHVNAVGESGTSSQWRSWSDALAAEVLLLWRRPALPLIGAGWVLMVVVFGFGVPYIVYSTLDPAGEAAERAALLEVLLPSAAHTTAAGSYPLFGGAMMLIFGVLVTGSEYRWRTWQARLTQGPGRAQVIVAKAVAGAAAVLVFVVAAQVAALVVSMVIAAVTGQAVAWPPISGLTAAIGAAAFLSIAWMSAGLALGVICRGVGAALGVGLMWTLGLENALTGLAGIVPALQPVRAILLGPASGSLVASLGTPSSGGGGIGVSAYVSGPVACAVLLAYVAAGIAIALTLISRRDLT